MKREEEDWGALFNSIAQSRYIYCVCYLYIKKMLTLQSLYIQNIDCMQRNKKLYKRSVYKCINNVLVTTV